MRLKDQVLGVIGGGQLARMLCMAARRMDLRTVIWTGGLEAPASEIADEVVDAAFDDPAGCVTFCEKATVATVEFENIPKETLAQVDAAIGLHPSPEAIATCQHREREKLFLRENDIPRASFEVVKNAQELELAVKRVGPVCVMKTATFGYDGKGQLKLEGGENLDKAWEDFSCERAVVEAFIPFERELSVMVARGADGKMVSYDPAENIHRHHILDQSIVPARVAPEILLRAKQIAEKVVLALDYRGIIGVEFFLLPDGELLVNEMAPRPHNSGHHTIDACAISQFEQQLRAVLGLPLGSPRLLSPVVMLNLLGDMWEDETTAPDWERLFADQEAFLHLYGKEKAQGRRKMGHANFLGESIEEILPRVQASKEAWLHDNH